MWLRRLTSAAKSSSVPLELVKALRTRTNAPIVDCKAALLAANLDLDGAHRHLRTIGLANASKKASRQTTQGVIACARNADGAVLIELQTETDFVAKNERFLALADKLSHYALDECRASGMWAAPDIEVVRDRARDDLNDAFLAVRENIVLNSVRALRLDQGQKLATYIHNRSLPNMGQIGVMLRYIGDNEKVADQITMHIAAAAPLYLTAGEIPAGIVEGERAVLTEQAGQLGKSETVTKGIIEGKLRKWRADHALMEQTFALGDAGTRIADMLEGIEMDAFIRMRVGESST